MACYLCGLPKELRPYGPKGEMVCFACAMQPSNKAATERQFLSQMEAAGPVVVIGTEAGPFPADHDPIIREVIRNADR